MIYYYYYIIFFVLFMHLYIAFTLQIVFLHPRHSLIYCTVRLSGTILYNIFSYYIFYFLRLTYEP